MLSSLERTPRATPQRRLGLAASVLLHVVVAGFLLVHERPPVETPGPLVRVVLFQPRSPGKREPHSPPRGRVSPRSPVAARRAPARGAFHLPSPTPVPDQTPATQPAPAPSEAATLPEDPDESEPDAVQQPAGETAAHPSTSGPRGASDVAHPPVILQQVRPEYPPHARRFGITGLVRLEAVVDSTGVVRDPIRVLVSVPELDAAAIAALRRWRFAPARDERGRPVPVIIEVPLRFVLR